MNIKDEIHSKIMSNCDSVCAWFDKKSSGLAFPVYASFDVRDSGWKIAPVDANIFPAGFNNICPVDKEHAPELMQSYLKKHYSQLGHRVALLTEEHTSNAYYWENVATIQNILIEAGYEALVCIPRELNEPLDVKSISGKELKVYSAENKNGEVFVDGKKADLIICNNDFSDSYAEWSQGLSAPMNPPRELGWYRRRKHTFFQQYNKLAQEFADIIKIDSSYVQVDTELFEKFDANDSDSFDALATRVDEFLLKLKTKYKKQGINEEPFCFIKNNAGTYGLAVIQAHSGAEIRDWNSKSRKKMKAAKGGREVDELIIQEGIPTIYREPNGGSAEPCIYMLGGELVGGFLRTHSEKGPDESLNSPGAVYKKLCMSDLQVNQLGCPMENVYGWTSKMGVLAIALEAQAGGVKFRNYEN